MTQGNKDTAKRAGLLRSAAVMSAITVGSRVLGLVREQVRGGLLGTSMASDAFGLAFQIPNLLRRMVAEGAMSSAFIPVLSEVDENEGREAAFTFATRYFNLVLLALTIISALGMVFASSVVSLFVLLAEVGGHEVGMKESALAASLTRWMFPYIGLVALAAVAQGILNTYRVFWISAASSIALNLGIIGAALALAGSMDEPAYALAIGVLVGGFLQFAVQVPYVFKLGYRWRPDWKVGPGIKKAMRLLVPTLFGAGVYQVNVMVSQAVALGLGEGAVSSLQFSQRLLELALGVFAVAISTVVLPSLSRDAAAGRLDEVRSTVLYAVRLCTFVCLPMLVGLFLLRAETTSLLFERGAFDRESTALTAYAIAFHVLGLLHIALVRIFVPVFYAFKDTRTPVLVGVASVIVNIVLCYVLAEPFAHGGIALANTASAFLHALLLTWLLSRHLGRIEDDVTATSLLRSGLATGAMGTAVWFLAPRIFPASATGAALLPGYVALLGTAVVVFVATAWVLRHPELHEVAGILRRKLRRKS